MDPDQPLPGAGWDLATVGHLRVRITRLTPEQLNYVVPQLKEWRERAIELQHEPALMAAEQMRHWEQMDKLADAWERYQRRDLSQEEFEGTVAEMAESWRRKHTPKT